VSRKPTRRILIAALTVALGLLLAVGALAAHPKAGKKYTGFTSAVANGFKAPISFKVSSDGKRLLGFTWAGGSCFGGGGPGDPFTAPSNIYKVGTIKVSPSGKFSVKNAKSTFTGPPKEVTFSTINGQFKTSNKATGTIQFKQKQQGQTCSSFKSPPTTFTATTP
jgi:hypothetical protein